MTPGRVLCIGDIHGCADELERLLAAVRPTDEDRLVFLGDYVDRGPASKEIISFLIDLQRRLPKTTFLRGNHEEMFLGYLGYGGLGGELFVRGGGAATLRSYGAAPHDAARAPADVQARIPEEHVAFLRKLELWRALDKWIFVHAGIRPGVPLEKQIADDVLWIREEFFCSDHGLDATVVFGHTPHRDVVFSPARRIALDTGCVYGGYLSCLDLSGAMLYQVRRGTQSIQRRDVFAQVQSARGL